MRLNKPALPQWRLAGQYSAAVAAIREKGILSGSA
jgi:hypothetical protein